MTFLNPRNFALEVSRGNVTGISCVQKFGESPNGVQTTSTDIWSRADSTPTQQIWLAPTAARIHAIVSTSTDDDGSPVGNGARTLRIYGLQTWDLAETSEDITLNGTTPVNTANSYVIIHRMTVLTSGSASINVGSITATAATNSTVTAMIDPGVGQTEMAIYGVPSIQKFYLTRWGCSIDKATAGVISCDFRVLVNENPSTQTTNFLRKEDVSLQSTGSNVFEKNFETFPQFAGPCIIKINGIASSNDTDAHAWFNGYIVNN